MEVAIEDQPVSYDFFGDGLRGPFTLELLSKEFADWIRTRCITPPLSEPMKEATVPKIKLTRETPVSVVVAGVHDMECVVIDAYLIAEDPVQHASSIGARVVRENNITTLGELWEKAPKPTLEAICQKFNLLNDTAKTTHLVNAAFCDIKEEHERRKKKLDEWYKAAQADAFRSVVNPFEDDDDTDD